MNANDKDLKQIHVIGAGGLARDFHVCFKSEVSIAGYWDDGVNKGTNIKGKPVLGTLDEFCSQNQSLNYVIMVANPVIRNKFISILSKTSHISPIIIHSLARIFDSASVKIGNGCVIFPGSMLTTDITVGEHTLIHTNCSLHHDSKVGSNCVLMPGSRLTGNVEIGNDVLIGANIALSNGMKIVDGEKILK